MNPVDARILIDAIRKSGKKFTPWESGFLNSIETRASGGQYLIGNQGKPLQKLYRRKIQGDFEPRKIIA